MTITATSRLHLTGWRLWVRRLLIALASILVLTVGAAAWFLTRPPKPAVLIDPAPAGVRVTAPGLLGNFYPASAIGRPVILLLGGSEGGLARDPARQAEALQGAGFNVMHLAYHNAPGKPASLSRVPLEDFARGLAWLRARPGVDGSRVAIVGYSKGAEAALLVATRTPGIRAIVAGMPSSVSWAGLDAPSMLLGLHSSWTERGEPVPFLPYGSYDDERGVISVFERGLKALPEHQDAVIPAERFAGRLLLVCGARDTLWPSCLMADAIRARAPSAGLLRYPLAGHGVMGVPMPLADPTMAGFAKLGGTAQANNAARADSWPKIVAFLRAALASE